jgi:lipopolysaccharide cholinephosphotransferase
MNAGFLDEEVRSGYKVTRDIKKLWSVQLRLLEKFMTVCDEHNLEYFAMFGTMLGAVRHGGFIPWDDDVDVAMPRDDYDRLSRMTELFESPFFLQTPENDPAAAPRFMRLRDGGTTFIPPDFPNFMTKGGHFGCYIDILPLDDAPSGFAARRIARAAARCGKFRKRRAPLEEMDLSEMPDWKRKHCRMPFPRTYAELTERYRAICTRYHARAERAKYYTIPVLLGDRGALLFEKSLFSAGAPMDFEHLTVRVPSGHEALIRRIWKDGAALPHVSEREPKHVGFIDTDAPYTAYTARYTDVFEGLAGKEVLLFGAGNMLNIYMERHGERFPPRCVFDNDEKKWGRAPCGVPVLPPARIPEMKGEDTRLIVISLYHKEIGEQLLSMGVPEYFVFMDGWKY